jgi:hypothetical protein
MQHSWKRRLSNIRSMYNNEENFMTNKIDQFGDTNEKGGPIKLAL